MPRRAAGGAGGGAEFGAGLARVGRAEEQGLDVFGKASDGRWHIVRFMTYERP